MIASLSIGKIYKCIRSFSNESHQCYTLLKDKQVTKCKNISFPTIVIHKVLLLYTDDYINSTLHVKFV